MTKLVLHSSFLGILLFLCLSCGGTHSNNKEHGQKMQKELTAKGILGNPNYLAIAYGGYRETTRKIQPTVEQLIEDMKILAAMNIKIVRTYHTKLPHASNLLRAIKYLKDQDPNFEMYVMLGVWIDCESAWTDKPNHDKEDEESNAAEVQRAVNMANKYPDIVKIIAVGNEAMVKWAESYYVQAGIILKWVNHLQDLKNTGKLSKTLWITSSDNFASWGGGDNVYHTKDLTKLIKAVDYVSLHTYPMHDTHYNPQFWGIREQETNLPDLEKIALAMKRAKEYAVLQYQNTLNYIKGIDAQKPVHIGETGWASASNGFYGKNGSKATDEYKEGLYYKLMREWTNKKGISCFYFEAFDEPWKDAKNPGGSENHFGLFDVQGQAKYALWELVDQGVFKGLSRGGHPILKTYNGNLEALYENVAIPPVKKELMLSY